MWFGRVIFHHMTIFHSLVQYAGCEVDVYIQKRQILSKYIWRMWNDFYETGKKLLLDSSNLEREIVWFLFRVSIRRMNDNRWWHGSFIIVSTNDIYFCLNDRVKMLHI